MQFFIAYKFSFKFTFKFTFLNLKFYIWYQYYFKMIVNQNCDSLLSSYHVPAHLQYHYSSTIFFPVRAGNVANQWHFLLLVATITFSDLLQIDFRRAFVLPHFIIYEENIHIYIWFYSLSPTHCQCIRVLWRAYIVFHSSILTVY